VEEKTMALKRVVVEMGMGTDIRGGDYTKAAVRALRDALWHNSLGVTGALGMDVDSMRIEVVIGVPKPEAVDKAQVLAVLPHGTGEVRVVHGGLVVPTEDGREGTIIANAAAIVRLDLPGASGWSNRAEATGRSPRDQSCWGLGAVCSKRLWCRLRSATASSMAKLMT
jgi:uncharacterized protein (TIGR02058 family)